MSKLQTKPADSVAEATADPAAARRNTILEAGLAVFMRYGFNRATMDDIAGEAGISRPALYRDFRNKADIYAALAARVLDAASEAAQRALLVPGSLEERLNGAIAAGILEPAAEVSASPHGAEILDQKKTLTGDIIQQWHSRLTRAMAAAIAEEAERQGTDLAGRDLSANALAEAILDGLDGAKLRSNDPAEWKAAAGRQIRLSVLALR